MRAIEYLRQMPAVFTNRDLMRKFGQTEAWVKLSLTRWKGYGLVKPAGPRLGIYYNLVVDPDWKARLPEAVKLAFPSAVVIGATVLHRHGWTTQIPQYLFIAVLKSPSQPKMDGVLAFGRPRSWYVEFSPWGESIYGLPALSPFNALRDCHIHVNEKGMWCPDEDDLDIPDEEEEAVLAYLDNEESR